MNILDMLKSLWDSTGFVQGTWQNYVMIAVSFVLFYLAIARKFEPLLLLPIAFGMLMVNIPGASDVLFFKGYSAENHTLPSGETGGLFYYLYQGVDKVIYPPLIFLGIGAMTDFGPLISNPKSLIIGAGAQLGIFITFFGAILLGFKGAEAASIAIIGGADGPTAIYLNQQLSKIFPDVGNLLPAIAIAAYSYMALIPAIQPPLMRLLTTKKERSIRMAQLRPVSKKEKIIFPIVVVCLVAIILPQALPLVGCLMLGNLLKESTVTERLAKTASNELINIVTIILGLMVGAKAIGPTFLKPQTLMIIALGLIAFCFGTAAGVLFGKLMCIVTKGAVNPLIGSAGVSAVPMAARVSQKVGAEEDPTNFLLMHAMGPNVAGVIGTAVAAGTFMAVFGVF